MLFPVGKMTEERYLEEPRFSVFIEWCHLMPDTVSVVSTYTCSQVVHRKPRATSLCPSSPFTHIYAAQQTQFYYCIRHFWQSDMCSHITKGIRKGVREQIVSAIVFIHHKAFHNECDLGRVLLLWGVAEKQKSPWRLSYRQDQEQGKDR